MANAGEQKKGLTTFGWLLVGGAAAFLLGNKDRREKALNAVKGFTDKFGGNGTDDSPANS